MADKEKKGAAKVAKPEKPAKPVKVEKVEHKNIYAALAAFQAENPTIKRTKNVKFEAKGKIVDFWFAPLDEVLQVIRPLTSKHGLAITWEDAGDNKLVAAVYHESYTKERVVLKETTSPDGTKVVEYGNAESGVLRSMAIKVGRAGDMKEVGGDSTYARRYTVSEVLGIAPDEDNDAAAESARLEKVEGFAFKQAMARVQGAKNEKTLAEQVTFFKKELGLLEVNKPSSLGFTKEQYEELLKAAEFRGKSFKGEDETAPAGEGQGTIL